MLNLDNDDARRTVEQCFRTHKTLLNPIIDWEDSDVWHFLNDIAKVPHCELYDRGMKRLGCIGCPMADNKHELKMYPKYKQLYLNAFERMIKNRKESGLNCVWETADEVMKWWLQEQPDAIEGQIDIDELMVSEAVDDE